MGYYITVFLQQYDIPKDTPVWLGVIATLVLAIIYLAKSYVSNWIEGQKKKFDLNLTQRQQMFDAKLKEREKDFDVEMAEKRAELNTETGLRADFGKLITAITLLVDNISDDHRISHIDREQAREERQAMLRLLTEKDQSLVAIVETLQDLKKTQSEWPEKVHRPLNLLVEAVNSDTSGWIGRESFNKEISLLRDSIVTMEENLNLRLSRLEVSIIEKLSQELEKGKRNGGPQESGSGAAASDQPNN